MRLERAVWSFSARGWHAFGELKGQESRRWVLVINAFEPSRKRTEISLVVERQSRGK